MQFMFYNANGFNQPLDSWDVSSVTSMKSMFYNADGFNQPLDSWNVSSVTTMRRMFFETSNFYQCISSWAIKTTDDPESLDVSGMFKDSGCPYERDPDISRGPWCDVPGNSCSSCYDDPGFRFEGQDSKNCEWAASELIEQRCLKEGVLEGCPRTCNPVCSGTTCVNDPDFRLGGVKAKSCEWVAKRKTEERCKKPGVFAACPESCNPACATVVDCTDDQDFQLNGLKGKNCEWVAKQKTDERCNKTGVMASCRRTCNPKCGCKDSMDEFQFQGSTITCKDLDIINCDAEPEPKLSSDEFTLAQLMQLQELLNPIHQRLDAIEDAVVEEGNETPNEVETFRDLCPNKCKTCV
jgi:surface protein